MTAVAALRRRLLLLARSERGIALPTALFATIAAIGLGSVAVMSSVDVQHGTTRDNGSKSAIAAADAGANVALQRQNRYAPVLSKEKPCLNANAQGKLEPGAQSATELGWCTPVKGEVGGTAYTYQVSTAGGVCGGQEVCIVSTGTEGGVTRRVELSLKQAGLTDPTQEATVKLLIQKETEGKTLNLEELKVLEEKIKAQVAAKAQGGSVPGLFGKDEITVSGNGDIRVGVGTNGGLVTSGNASICGDIQVGIGKTWTKSGNAKQCSGYKFTQGTTTLPEVSSFIPPTIATKNSNGRITTCSNKGLPAECQKDTLGGGNWSNNSPFNPSTRALDLSGNTTLTVGGGDYWLCSMSFSGNSKLIMASGAHVRFFFDTPEHCGTSNQISMSGNNEISATGYKPSSGIYDMPGFYLLGSTTSVSQVSLSGNNSTTDEFVIYGPNSYVNISGNATFKGIVAGKQIAMSGNGTIEQDAGFKAPPEITPAADETVLKTLEKELEEKKVSLKKREEIIKQEELRLKAGIGNKAYFAAGYVECTGTVALGQAPNSGC
jgi:hypothetical protein